VEDHGYRVQPQTNAWSAIGLYNSTEHGVCATSGNIVSLVYLDNVAGNLQFWNMHKGAWNKHQRWKKHKETDESHGMEQVWRHGTHKGWNKRRGMEQASDGTSKGWNKQRMGQ
jgi:hypothetical protein